MEFKQRDNNYEVGYGKPPKHTRFQKGQSGNPRGRRRSALNYVTLFRKELQQRAILKDGGRTKVTLLQLLIQQIIKRAVHGDLPSIRLVFQYADVMKASQSDESPEPGSTGGPQE